MNIFSYLCQWISQLIKKNKNKIQIWRIKKQIRRIFQKKNRPNHENANIILICASYLHNLHQIMQILTRKEKPQPKQLISSPRSQNKSEGKCSIKIMFLLQPSWIQLKLVLFVFIKMYMHISYFKIISKIHEYTRYQDREKAEIVNKKIQFFFLSTHAKLA